MGLLRKRLQRRTMVGGSSAAGGAGSTSTTAGNRKGSALTKLTIILSLYVVWAAHTVSKKPQLKTQLQERFQLLLKDKNLYAFVFPSKAKASKKNHEVKTNNKDADADVEIVEKNIEHLPIDNRFLEAFYNTKGWKDTNDIVIEWEEAFKKRFRQAYLLTAEYATNEEFDHTTKKRYTIEIPDPYTDNDHNNNNNDNDDEYDYDVDENDNNSNDGDESSPTTTKIPFPRIPCGLILVVGKEGEDDDDEEVEVLPVSTCIGNGNVNGIDNADGISLLNDRVFQRYPHLAKHKQVLVGTNDHGNSVAPPLIILPEGTFSFRMGSVEATIEKSPGLLLFQSPTKKADDSDDDTCDLNVAGSCDNENSNTEEDDVNYDCDLILGKQFWDNHATEFQDDELYLSTIATTATATATKKGEGEGDTQSAEIDTATGSRRVMVPYIRIRQPFP